MNSKTKLDRAIIFSQCEFFIDYYSSQNGTDRSLRLGNELEKKYGAKIVEQPRASSTTHIIFKNGNIQTKLFAKKYHVPLIDPLWLESCIKKRRLIPLDKYQIVNDENFEELPFEQLIISNKELMTPCTPKMRDGNIDSGKKAKKILYTPVRGQFDQGNPEEFFDHQNRIITLDNLGMNLPDDDHMLIHRYGCSVVRRQLPQTEIQDQPSLPLKQQEFPSNLSQSQSSPIIHFANAVPRAPALLSPSCTFDYDTQKQYAALGDRPQSTPILRPTSSPKEILIEKSPSNAQLIPPLKTIDYSSFTRISPLKTKPTNRFEFCNEFISPEVIIELEKSDQIIPRPPPLLALSQAIRRKYPVQLNEPLSSIKDLPNVPANYSFVFYGFTSTQLEEAKRLTRRMGDCFLSETIDMSTTHVILPDDDPQMILTLDILLALIYGCRFVIFEWLKSSSRIGEWLNVNKFEPKHFYQMNPSLNIYRKIRQQQKSIHLFNECGLIYLTSIAKQRTLLLKLITLLGGNITVNRNSAQIIIGQSSKPLQVIIYPQVTEQWVIDSIKSGGCLPPDDYLINN